MNTITTSILTVLLCLSLAGCAAVQYGQSNPETARLVTNQITARFIQGADNPAERASAVRYVVQTLRSEVDSNAEATLGSLEARAREEIDWSTMSVADQQIIEFALLKARQSLSRLIGDGLLDPNEKAPVGTLLDWIDDAAQRAEMVG